MDMATSTLWWIAAGVAVAAELGSGTFFLLMIALGLAAGGLAAALDAGLVGQLLTAALVGGGAVALWSSRRARRPASLPASANPDVQTDIGSRVHVTHWQADGTSRVRYRGADWTARWGGADTPPGSGDHLVQAVDGNQLIVVPAPASTPAQRG
jgi:membrane protein implicated in regulation of membrane protease activity